MSAPYRYPLAQGLAPHGLGSGVGAHMSTRLGGLPVPAGGEEVAASRVEASPWASFNVSDAVGDDPSRVAAHRQALATALGVEPIYLRQVHGVKVLRLGQAEWQAQRQGQAPPEADASISTEPGLACAVMVADCLPVLFAAPQGRAVGAAHAGWRGLCAGVLEATVHALCEAAACEPAELQAWLGPCIGPDAFEVGGEVKEAFLAAAAGSLAEQAAVRARFRPWRPPGAGTHGAERTQHAQKWLADLPGLASDRLAGLGLQRLALSGLCTHSRPEQLFSYRRDGQTGRMVACIWRLPKG